MDNTFFMRCRNFSGKEKSFSNISRYFTCDIIALNRNYFRILVCIFFFCLSIASVNNRQNFCISRIGFPKQFMLIPISDIVVCKMIGSDFHQCIYDHILNTLNTRQCICGHAFGFNRLCDFFSLCLCQTVIDSNTNIGFQNRFRDFTMVEIDFRTISFANLHKISSLKFEVCINAARFQLQRFRFRNHRNTF